MKNKNSPTLYYTWGDFEYGIKQIRDTASIDFLTWLKFKTIVAVGKGGLPLGVKLSNVFGLPLKIIEASSYKNKKQKELCVEQFNPIMWENPILLVDDIADSGNTLKYVKEQLEVWGKKVTTLTLFLKPKSIIKPDYYLGIAPNKTWVNFPWE